MFMTMFYGHCQTAWSLFLQMGHPLPPPRLKLDANQSRVGYVSCEHVHCITDIWTFIRTAADNWDKAQEFNSTFGRGVKSHLHFIDYGVQEWHCYCPCEIFLWVGGRGVRAMLLPVCRSRKRWVDTDFFCHCNE